MGSFILRRIGYGALVVLGVTLTVFLVTRVFGDPIRLMLPLNATEEQRAALSAQLGLNEPLIEQFITFAGDLLTLDLGESVWQRRPAIDVVMERLPMTLGLIGVGLGFAIVASLPLGTIAALRPGGMLDRVIASTALLGLSVPQFWMGLLLILVFSVKLGLLPTSGMGTPAHIVLPAVTLALTPLARLTMLVRSAMIDELNRQYVMTARAKGLSLRRLLGVHALRNVLISFLTLAGWELIIALAGYTVVVETVFAWPGLGHTAIQAIERGDLYLIQAIVFTVAVGIVLINLALDITFKIIDPRIDLN